MATVNHIALQTHADIIVNEICKLVSNDSSIPGINKLVCAWIKEKGHPIHTLASIAKSISAQADATIARFAADTIQRAIVLLMPRSIPAMYRLEDAVAEQRKMKLIG